MSAIPDQTLTLEAFEAIVSLPENADKRFEWVGGEIVEVPSNTIVSEIAIQIAFLIKLFLHQNHLKGHVTGEAGGYQIGDERYAPDVAYVSPLRQEKMSPEPYNPNPPDLAVEVVSPHDRERHLSVKVANYLAAGVVVWVVYPDEKLVQVYAPGAAVKILYEKDTLEGGAVLPGFSVVVGEFFPN